MYSFYVPHDPVIQDVGTESMTRQEFKDECDINNIIRQFQLTGIVEHINSHAPEYLDLPDSFDYQTSLDVLYRAEDAFAALPAKVRDHFGNDPAKFLGAFQDPGQEAQLREWGLLRPKRPPDPAAAKPESPAPAQGA